jgi:hypothetical protein
VKKKLFIIFVVLILLIIIILIAIPKEDYVNVLRKDVIPTDIVKMTPALDNFPPILHSNEFEYPIPLPVISSAGAEDSPFIPANRDEIFFVFVPDTRIPPEKQVLDGASGIWFSEKINDSWTEPTRVWLQDPGKLSLDGCTFVDGDYMLFCSAREGYTGLHWVSAERKDGIWQNWKVDDFNPEFEVGELHITTDGKELYYHSKKDGGLGDTDIWMLTNINGEWKNPVNVEIVNSEVSEGMPYISPDQKELWFNRWYLGSPAIYRSKKINGEWQEPELIISQFAGEPTLDSKGNLYFVHHYYQDSILFEADIYVAYKK